MYGFLHFQTLQNELALFVVRKSYEWRPKDSLWYSKCSAFSEKQENQNTQANDYVI